MPELEKYSEEFKSRKIYEARQQGSLARDILSQWKENKRLTARMAQLEIAVNNVKLVFKPPFDIILNDLTDDVPTSYRGVDAYAIEAAIRAEGQTALKLQAEEQKKPGLLGKIGL
jgi:hypothetical protein